jgi:hypothetical protein
MIGEVGGVIGRPLRSNGLAMAALTAKVRNGRPCQTVATQQLKLYIKIIVFVFSYEIPFKMNGISLLSTYIARCRCFNRPYMDSKNSIKFVVAGIRTQDSDSTFHAVTDSCFSFVFNYSYTMTSVQLHID